MFIENANTMFNADQNAVFNNNSAASPIIPAMHEQMTRLYRAAETLKKAVGPAAVARLLNMSQGRVQNWESRGISVEGLLEAQEKIGCDAIWLRDGVGDMVRGKTPEPTVLDVPTLQDAITAALEIDRLGNLKLSPEKLGILAAYWYDEWQEKGPHKPTLNEANRILRLVA
jgi:DNA-binding transcriptional regulator YiaG